MSSLYCSGAGQPSATLMGIWGRPSDPVKRIVSQNVRGMRDEYADKQEALVEWAKNQACVRSMLTRGVADGDEGSGQRPRPRHAHGVGAHHARTADGSMREGIPGSWHPPEPGGEGRVGEGLSLIHI